MIKIQVIILLTLVLLIFVSCTKYEKIENFPIEQPTLVANALLQEGKPITIDVSRSLSVLDNAEIKPVTDARVILFVNDVASDTIFQADPDNKYYSNRIAHYSTNYKIQVSHPKYNTITSTTESLPPPLLIKDISVKVIDSTVYQFSDYSSSGYFTPGKTDTVVNYIMDVSFVLIDPEGYENRYVVFVMKEDSSLWGEPRYWYKNQIYGLQTSDPSIINDNQSYRNGTYSAFYVDDHVFNGKEHKFSFRIDETNSGQSTLHARYFLNIKSFTASSYKYFRSLGENYDSSSPFDEPSRVFSNITNGYGIFAGQEIKEFRIK